MFEKGEREMSEIFLNPGIYKGKAKISELIKKDTWHIYYIQKLVPVHERKVFSLRFTLSHWLQGKMISRTLSNDISIS